MYKYIEKAYSNGDKIYYDCSLTFVPGVHSDDEEGDPEVYEQQVRDYRKLYNNVCRAVSNIKSYGLANDWDYMVTFTLSQDLLDRIKVTDRYTGEIIPLRRSGYDAVMRAISKHFGNLSRKYNSHLSYILIPELHLDGENYHFHGLMSGVPPDRVELHSIHRLGSKGYLDWPDFSRKFGSCSLGKIRSREAAVYYSLKYICKDLNIIRSKYSHLYYVSKRLNKPEEVFRGYNYSCSPYVILSNPKMHKSNFDSYYGRAMSSDERDWLFDQLNFCEIYSNEVYNNGYNFEG